jgi:hypothetical protein
MRIFVYILGYLLLIGGLAWGALVIGVPLLYVQIVAVIFLGLGLIGAATRTRTAHVVTNPPVTVVRDQDTL